MIEQPGIGWEWGRVGALVWGSGSVQWSVFAKVFERNAAKKAEKAPSHPLFPSPQGPLP